MEAVVKTDFHEDGSIGDYYEKTAGDMVQSYWCRKHLVDMSQCFQRNETQCAIARWLKLPHLVLPPHMATQVMSWGEHALADFQEQLTLYLPSSIVWHYLEVCTAFHVHWRVAMPPRCAHRNDRGLLCCDKVVSGRHGRFCSMKHCISNRCRVRAPFDGKDYGQEYLCVEIGDILEVHDHKESSGGWSWTFQPLTGRHGWVPTEYVRPQ